MDTFINLIFLIITLISILYLITQNQTPKNSSQAEVRFVLDYFSTLQNKKTLKNEIIVQAWQGNYNHTLLGSLSNYLFEPLDIIKNFAKETNENLIWKSKQKFYICVHDTGCGVHTAKEWNEAVVNEFIDGKKYSASFQYVVGNDGIYHNIPDDIIGFHAGDGTKYEYKLYDSNVEFNGNYNPIITISNDGYFEIDYVKSVIKAPLKNGEIPLTSDINDQGIRTIVDNGKYYLGETWFSNDYNKVSNHGGNVNSIGIESCVNKGSDIYYTWMKDAKLIAFLMDKYNLGINDVVPHHFFSGKDCPMTMRHSNMYQHVKDLALIEFKILQFVKNGFKISFNCDNKEFVSDNGKVIKIPQYDLNVNYVITVEKDGYKESRVFSSVVTGENTLEE
jgi:N-acetylmuramoyl-L-alanine amidase CwlA